MKQCAIGPSILSADFTKLGAEIAACESAGIEWIHVDVMDGHFVPNITMGPFIVAACRRATSLPLDVHLMIENPERYLEAFAKAGATRMNVHIEACSHIQETLQQIKDLGCEAGVAISPDTPLDAIQDVLQIVDLVLVMSVYPGYSGQTFLPQTVERVSELRQHLDAVGSRAWVEVDGGIDLDNVKPVTRAGATAYAVATTIFKYPAGPAAGVRALRAAIEES